MSTFTLYVCVRTKLFYTPTHTLISYNTRAALGMRSSHRASRHQVKVYCLFKFSYGPVVVLSLLYNVHELLSTILLLVFKCQGLCDLARWLTFCFIRMELNYWKPALLFGLRELLCNTSRIYCCFIIY